MEKKANEMKSSRLGRKNPFWDGRAGERIVKILENSLKIQVKTNI